MGASLVHYITLKMPLPTQTIMITWKRVPKVALLDFHTFSAPESRMVCKAVKSSYPLGPFWDLTLFLPAMGRISPYMSIKWPSSVGIGLRFRWKSRQVECYDLPKLRFSNSRQLWIIAKLYIVTNLKFATTKHPTFINFLQNLPPRKAWEGNMNS